jgi:hypothetical protein
MSNKGLWRTFGSLTGYHGGLDPARAGLKDQGLVSVKELWVNIHYSRPGGIRFVS